MKVCEYLATRLSEAGATDVFGVPGGAVLDILYACDKHPALNVHLNYHEQAAGYAALGYVQSGGRLGVVYATKGPGISNYITPMIEAYQDSFPIVFLSSHTQTNINKKMRSETGQEMDTVRFTSQFTKYSVKIEKVEDAKLEIDRAIEICLCDRKGPVFIDILAGILKKDILDYKKNEVMQSGDDSEQILNAAYVVIEALSKAKKPVMLIGDGVRLSGMECEMRELSEILKIPILSSRCSQDLLAGNRYYFGYIGSHAVRYANYILEQSDTVVAIGNRMAYPLDSKSYQGMKRKKIVRVDIDSSEFERKIEQALNLCVDIKQLIPHLIENSKGFENKNWIKYCSQIKKLLVLYDMNPITFFLSKIIKKAPINSTIVCDEGDNELWLSRAYAFANTPLTLMHSKTLKTVGCAIGKAIGAYYCTKAPVMCIVGDQGIQFNIQELQFISSNNLPVSIFILNNNSPGMMRSSEKRLGYEYYLHTTKDSGYSNPDFKGIAKAYGIYYMHISKDFYEKECDVPEIKDFPQIIEMELEENLEVEQYLPKGNKMTEFYPPLDDKTRKAIEEFE